MKNIVVAIETSGVYLGVSIGRLDGENYKSLATVYKSTPGQQAELLIPTLRSLLTKKKLKTSDIGLVAVDIGPGSFTGVRVGVAAARAIAQTLNIPLMGISSLEAMAWDAAKKNSSEAVIVPSRAALANEVYFAVYRKLKAKRGFRLQPVVDPVWAGESVLIDQEKKLDKKKSTRLIRWSEAKQSGPHPDSIARLAVETFVLNDDVNFNFESVVPLYLQPSWAERNQKYGVLKKD